jgi:hypothetical protein
MSYDHNGGAGKFNNRSASKQPPSEREKSWFADGGWITVLIVTLAIVAIAVGVGQTLFGVHLSF